MSPGKAVNPSIHEAMKRARLFFLERAEAQPGDPNRELYDQLRHVADGIEETTSLVEHLRVQVEEIRHAMGLHLEAKGNVPHTRRRPRSPRPRTAPA